MKRVSKIIICVLFLFTISDAFAKKKNNKNSRANSYNKKISRIKKNIREAKEDIASNQKKIDKANSGEKTSASFSGTASLEKRKKSLQKILARYEERLKDAEAGKNKAQKRKGR